MTQYGRVELRGVGVRYGRRSPWVLRDVTLTVPPGALVEVTGRNGAGKSSLLRVLAGVLAPAAGSVLGRPADVGWAPERFPSAQAVRTGDYLRAQAAVRGLGRAAAAAVTREVERFGLRELLDVPLPELSKGSAQKVGLAQALLGPPRLLVLDEPWSGLDATARAAVPDVVREVLTRGGTVAVADHSAQVVALAPDARWHAEQGRVQEAPTGPERHVTVSVDVPAGAVGGAAGAAARAGPDGAAAVRVLALTAFRLRAALSARVLLAPLVALVAVQLVGLSGGAAPAGLLMVTAAAFAFPVLGWAARQVLDAEPDDQVRLSALAVGGPVPATAAHLLAAAAVTAPASLLCAWASLQLVDEQGVSSADLAAGTAVAVSAAAAATAVGAVAARSVSGTGVLPVAVLVGAPVLVAVLGLTDSPVGLLVPRLAVAVRAAYDGDLAGTAPRVVGLVLLWSAAVLGLRLVLGQRLASAAPRRAARLRR
jgi:ABC-type Mn2+/Zn2+ transport system ATPase subunit